MKVMSKGPVAALVASCVLAVSLTACEEGKLEGKIRKDGSIDFVATGQVTQSELTAQGGIMVDKDQGLSIDPSAMEEGSMHIRILLPDDDAEGQEPDATADPDQEETGTEGATEDGGKETEGEQDADDGDKDLSKDIASAAASAIKPIPPKITGDVVFERTLSAMDAEGGIITVTDLEEGYYLVYVSAEHATGTIKVRSYDLSRQEIRDRDSQKAVDKAKEIIDGLFGGLDDVAEGTDDPGDGERTDDSDAKDGDGETKPSDSDDKGSGKDSDIGGRTVSG